MEAGYRQTGDRSREQKYDHISVRVKQKIYGINQWPLFRTVVCPHANRFIAICALTAAVK
jgi:hypothetical protein